MQLHPTLTEERIVEAVQADDCLGFCLACGEEAGNLEPDAENYLCENCGERKVFGAEQILFLLPVAL